MFCSVVNYGKRGKDKQMHFCPCSLNIVSEHFSSASDITEDTKFHFSLKLNQFSNRNSNKNVAAVGCTF